MKLNSTSFDAVVIGGSYAGLSAALQLARARRPVLVIDSGLRRNRFAPRSHGFLGQDGREGAAIAAEGKAQLLAYPNAQWLEAAVTETQKHNGHFLVSTDGANPVTAKRLVLATGVVDEMPAIEGLAERWGTSVFHCPYCHGHELGNGRIGLLAVGAVSLHQAMLLPDWGQVTMFLNDTVIPDEEQQRGLAARGVTIEAGRIARLVDSATVEMQDGRKLEMDGLFTACRTHMASPAAEQLGCTLVDGPLGPFIQTDEMQETTVPDVFACGDAARLFGNVALAVSGGALAGIAAHQSLIFRP